VGSKLRLRGLNDLLRGGLHNLRLRSLLARFLG